MFSAKLSAAGSAGCVPWYLPRLDHRICDPWAEQEFTRQRLSESSKRDCERRCMPDCQATEYSVAVSDAKFM